MINEYTTISKLETYLDSKLRSVCKNVYAGTLPSTLDNGTESMVVIDCGGALEDKGGYRKGTANIFLYAAPTKQGRKNVALFSKLETAYNEFLADCDNEHYAISEIYRSTDYDSNYNMHYIISAINIIIS